MAQIKLSAGGKKKKLMDSQKTCGCQGGGVRGGSGMDWEFGVNRCNLLTWEWISNEILLYSTGNLIWSLMMAYDGG